MKISFIVPCYNVEKYLYRCITSIYDQNLDIADFEVIAVNDGSTDNTLNILKSFKYENFHIINQKNQGLSGARNTGMAIATGKYIWFIDSDDFLYPGVTKPLLNRAEQYKLDILFFSMHEVNDNNRKLIYHSELSNYEVLSGENAILLNYRPNSVCASIYLNEFLRQRPQLKFYNKLYHQDVELNYRAIALAKRVMFIKEAPYIYEIHPQSISQSQNRDKIIKRLIDDTLIAISFRDFSQSISNRKVAKRIRQQSTSILLSVLVGLNSIKYDYRKEVIKAMKANGTFPVKSDFKSTKQMLLITLLNLKYFRY